MNAGGQARCIYIWVCVKIRGRGSRSSVAVVFPVVWTVCNSFLLALTGTIIRSIRAPLTILLPLLYYSSIFTNLNIPI